MARRQSNIQWIGGIAVHPTQPSPKILRKQKSAGKVLASKFEDQDGAHQIGFLPKDQTINAEYYSSLLVLEIEGHFEREKQGEDHKWALFSHDNTPTHRALATQKKLDYLAFQYLLHPLYSPYLAPSDYHLFPGLKNQLEFRHFSSDEEFIAAAETWLDGQYSDFYLSGLH